MRDQLQRTLHLKDTPKRIISLVPSQTELLCDLGLEDAIVGITKFCVHPDHLLKDIAIVGGTKQLHIERIKALRPDIILCNKEENTKEIVEACQSICEVHVSDVYTIADSLELIGQYGTIFNKADEALSLIDAIKEKQSAFEGFIQNKPVLKVVYFIWKSPWMVAANNTFINYMLQLNKYENVYSSLVRYPEIDLADEQKEIQNIGYAFLSSEPYPFKEKHKDELQAYWPDTKIVLVDGEMFSWYGTRLLKAFDYFKTLRESLQKDAF
ncbi:ABC transporter substrate-binding protein [Snuella sedimenti]|uniref:ABC transporter substrate-binding protein n=1 Tax=Snuella sedimenti TaxID=2798802 RepID=A0A8J7JD26_9FLAO|nr:helical backbone metal receptor [Snuella sedimenti]MBJ6368749.1 ABC transporter substrate-binding protein [Snuella sedimenti]